MNKKNKNKIIFIAVSIIVIGALFLAFFFYNKYRQINRQLSQVKNISQVQAQKKDEEKELIDKVGKLIMLPTDEVPIIATVSDISKLKDQAFFKSAKNGDKVLVYAKAKEAIMYRPSINKIVGVGPVSSVTGTPTPTNPVASISPATLKTSTSPTPATKKARVVLYNGTDTVGVTYTVEKELLASVKDIEIVDKDNAAKSDYKKTIVIDLSGGKFKEKTQELATLLKGEVGALPEGEKKPDADILVILSQ